MSTRRGSAFALALLGSSTVQLALLLLASTYAVGTGIADSTPQIATTVARDHVSAWSYCTIFVAAPTQQNQQGLP